MYLLLKKKEEIGIALVEAISRGQYIVGYDDATMNEYILMKKLVLYNEKVLNQVKAENIIDNYDFRIKNANLKYAEWNDSKRKILNFFDEKNELVKRIYFIPLFLLDDLKYYLKKIFRINFYY